MEAAASAIPGVGADAFVRPATLSNAKGARRLTMYQNIAALPGPEGKGLQASKTLLGRAF